ncbi:MAG: DUF3325 domain-containing protein [Pseudomonadota bacterium]
MGFIVTCLGAIALSVGMKRHYRQLFHSAEFTPRKKWVARFTGCALLTLGAYVSMAESGTGLGLTLYVGYLNVAVFGWALFLAWRVSRINNRAAP